MRMRTWMIAAALMGLACDGGEDPTTSDPPPEPGPFQAGLARARLPAPVGIGTAGFGPFGAPASDTPFSQIYPGTKRIFGHPEIEVVALSRGPGFEAVFVRFDTVGVFAQLRSEIVAEASARVGHDLDDAILIGATHTHSGPGRVLNTGTEDSSVFDLIVDKFDPEVYERVVDATAGAIAEAYADLAPARLGTTVGSCPDGINDRRCEDGEVRTNPALPLLAVEREGAIDAVVMSYPIHGTVLGIDELHLSQDVSGAIEQVTEDRFDRPVKVVMFNGWGGDMSPASPDIETVPTAERLPDYARMLRVGSVVADEVHAQIDNLVWDEAPELELSTDRIAIDREILGYDNGVFNYEYGAVYCGSDRGSCDPPERVDDLDRFCVPFNETFPAPNQVDATVGRIGPFSVVTFPGEALTNLGESVVEAMAAEDPDMGPVMFLGYTQDYLGYATLEEEWWYAGYEASGTLWGPRQGVHLRDELAAMYGRFVRGEPAQGPGPLEPFPYEVGERYTPATAVDPATVIDDVAETYAADEAVVFTIAGTDPWLLAPLATVVAEDGTPITRPNGAPLTSDHLDFDVALAVEPDWPEDAPDGRTFAWTFRLAPRSPVVGGLDLTGGRYRIEVAVPTEDGDAATVASSVFEVVDDAG